jgi:hypothetical protein
MADFTLSQLRNQIDPSCFSVNDVNADKNTLINKVREAFYYTPEMEGGSSALWKGAISQQTLPVVTQFPDADGNTFQTVTLTRGLATIVKSFDHDGPIGLRNEWETVSRAGQWDFRGLSDLSDGWCGISDLPTNGAQMKITSTGTEAGGLTVFFTGTDINGYSITETVSIPTSAGSASTLATFYSITSVVKSVTANALFCYQTTAAVDTLFARYEPGEQFPSYRRYRYAFKTNRSTITVKAKRQYYPLASDNDPVEFGSVLAFEHALRAYQWGLNGDTNNARQGMVDAIQYLNGEQAAYQSEPSEGVVKQMFVTSGGAIPNIP